MEKFIKCKLCTRSFTNGRALGGHMKGHLSKTRKLGQSTHSESSSSSEEHREKDLGYKLRANPKKSFRIADPEFSDYGFVVQDGESETESSRNPTKKRSKRTPKFEFSPQIQRTDPEPVSSVSDTSPEEDVAMSLMMLSRDIWIKEEQLKIKLAKKIRCHKCKKNFRSLQALTTHDRICGCGNDRKLVEAQGDEKIFECPFCLKVFGSGQALGGHKRSHISLAASSTATTATATATGTGTGSGKRLFESISSTIDLNFPAPMEEDDQLSVVSDA